MNNFIEKLKQLNADPNFTREEKTHIINEAFLNYRKQVDKDYHNYLTKQYAGEALQLAGALPQGRAAKLGMQYFGIPMAKHMGRNIAQQTGAGMFSGAAGGGLFGLGHGLSTDQNPLKTGAIGTGAGAFFGGTTSATIGKGLQAYKVNQLKNAFNNPKRFNLSNQYYRDYEQGVDTIRNDIGEIKLPSGGFKETNIQMPKYYDKTVNLSKNLKNADYIGIELPQHSHRYNITKFHRLRGNNVDYLVAENEKSNKYFHKVADPAVSGPKPEEQSLPQHIINHPERDFNPEAGNITLSGYVSKDVQLPQNAVKRWFNSFKGGTTGKAAPVTSQKNPYAGFRNPLTGNNKIYTRQEIGSMSDDDFEKNEKEIMSQVKTSIGIPHENDIKPFSQFQNGGVVYIKPYTRSDGVQVKGHYRSL